MKLLFNREVVEGNRVKARPSDYLKSLAVNEKITAVPEFLHWVEKETRDNEDLQAHAEAEIGVATATGFLQKLEQGTARIYTGIASDTGNRRENDPEN
jgi:hypothetical protein